MHPRSILYVTALFLLFSCSNTLAQGWVWAKSSGGALSDYGESIATDASGNVFVTGYFNSTSISFGSTTLTNAGSQDIFLVKYDASGNVLWATRAGGTGNDQSLSVATDNEGNVFITGTYGSSTITFGAVTLTNAGTSNIFLVKYSASGSVLWAKTAGGTGYDATAGVTTDASGNAYITGGFSSSTITFGTTTLTNAATSVNDYFVAKYNGAGNPVWAQRAGGTSSEQGFSITADSSGFIYVAGGFQSATLDFGSYSISNLGDYDLFVVKYDSSGTVYWVKSAGGTLDDVPLGITTDNHGNCIITGYYYSPSLPFGTTTLINAGTTNTFLAKFNSIGNIDWVKSFGGSLKDNGTSVTADASGNVYLTGEFGSSAITFGSTSLTNHGSYNIFFAKFDSTGNNLYAKAVGGTGADQAYGVACDATGDAYITGWLSSPTVNFGSTTLTDSGFYDIYTAKFSSTLSVPGISTESDSKLTLYPNPSTGIVTISLMHAADYQAIEVYDLTGRLMYHYPQKPTAIFTIQLPALPNGMYLLRGVHENGVDEVKFVISR